MNLQKRRYLEHFQAPEILYAIMFTVQLPYQLKIENIKNKIILNQQKINVIFYEHIIYENRQNIRY